MSLLVILAFLALAWIVARTMLRHRSSLFSVRGTGVRADLGRLHDATRVRLQALEPEGNGHTRLAFVPSDDAPVGEPAADVEVVFVVELDEGDAGFEILHHWLDQRADLAIVVPSSSRIIRLRSIDDLQPLTLRRVDP